MAYDLQQDFSFSNQLQIYVDINFQIFLNFYLSFEKFEFFNHFP